MGVAARNSRVSSKPVDFFLQLFFSQGKVLIFLELGLYYGPRIQLSFRELTFETLD